MTALLRTPARRIALAVALSLLAHALLLWLPHLTLPRFEPQLPLLRAKLEAVPVQPHRPPAHKRRIAQAKKPATPVLSQTQAAPAVTAPLPASGVPATSDESVAAGAAAQSAAVAAAGSTTSDKSSVPALPKHAQLRFAAYIGTNGMYVGEMRHNLEIFEDGHYVLQAELKTVGLASLFKEYHLTQTSRGHLTANRDLQPELFSEDKTDGRGTRQSTATFDWGAQQMAFADGTKVPLPAGAQDILSFLYQLSQESFNRELIPVTLSNGRKLEHYQLEVGGEEEVVTPMGKLRALHLRKVHQPGEEGLEIWLGLEYRLLPVKFRQIERSGEIAGELAIKEIRLADQ